MAGQVIDLDEIQARLKAGQPLAGFVQTQSANLLPRDLVVRLWTLMTEMYGHRWTSSFGDEIDPHNVWGAAMRGLTETQIRHGLGQCVALGHDWPPSAPEFRKLCEGRTDSDAWQHKTEAYKPFPPPALPDKTAEERRDSVAREHLAKMRSMFGMAPKGDAA